MKVTLTYDYKYRNWISACLYPFEAGKWASARWEMSSLCKWLHWHSQETNWRILDFRTARPAPFNAKGDLCSTHSDVDVLQTSRGHTYFVAAGASCHAQHVQSNCESLMHGSICVWVQERQRETEGETESISVRNILLQGGRHSSEHPSLTAVMKLTLTVICGGEVHQRAERRRRSPDGRSKRQPGGAGDHWWKLTVGWKRNIMHLLKRAVLYFHSCAVQQWNPVAATLEKWVSTVAADPSLAQKMWIHQQGSFFHLHHQWLCRGRGMHNIQLLSISLSAPTVDG